MPVCRPDGENRERVRLGGLVDETCVREGHHEHDGKSSGDRCRRPRPRGPDRDPGHESDEEERRNREGVALLDPTGELGGEGRDDQSRPDGERNGDSKVFLQPNREPPRPPEQHESRGDRHDAEVQGQLLRVPEPVAQDGGSVVRPVADDAVGSEQPAQRLTPQDLPRQHDQRGPGEQRVEAPGSADPRQPAALDDRERSRCEDDPHRERDRLAARRERERERHEHEHGVPPRRSRKREKRCPHDDERERVVEILRHHGRRIDERRESDREQRCEQRER